MYMSSARESPDIYRKGYALGGHRRPPSCAEQGEKTRGFQQVVKEEPT